MSMEKARDTIFIHDWKRQPARRMPTPCSTCKEQWSVYPTMAPIACADCWHVFLICRVCGHTDPIKTDEDVVEHHRKYCFIVPKTHCAVHGLKYVLPLKYPGSCLTCFKLKRKEEGDCCSCGLRSSHVNFIMYEKHGGFRICDECSKPRVFHRMILHLIEPLSHLVFEYCRRYLPPLQ